MLILQRMEQQKIIITVGGIDITVTVARIDRDKVRLGFTAPDSVRIDRKEVHDRLLAGEERRPS